jgi:TadE-like protein
VDGVRRAEDRERGASAVEFALVLPVLLLMLFGIVDYGLYFTNQLAVNQGVQEAARQAVVGDFGAGGCGMTWSSPEPNLATKKIGCLVQERTNPIVGTLAVKVVVPSGGWAKGRPLIVCAIVKTSGLSGFVPLPGGGIDTAETKMTIEQDPASPPPPTSGSQAPPTGDWSWCT